MVRRIALPLFLIGLVFGPARVGSASVFRVTPIRVDFAGRAASALLTLVNESDKELRFQVSAFSWSQSAGGEIQLQPTEDIVFFPALLSLKAGEERKVRIGRVASATDVEKTYRVFFEELPPLETKAEAGSQVRILTKMGIPIFVAPDARKAAGGIGGLKVADGQATFEVRNSGNVHFMVQTVRVTGLDATGQKVVDVTREGWYVLAGENRSYAVALTDCPKVRTVKVEVATDMSSKPEESLLKSEVNLPAPACAPAAK